MSELSCWNCGHDLSDVPRPISRHAQCKQCFEALRSCRMCLHYNEDVTGQCEHDRAEPPIRKESANFCEFFRPRSGAFDQRRNASSSSARSQLDALFGGDESTAGTTDNPVNTDREIDPDDPKAKLDALFKKSD